MPNLMDNYYNVTDSLEGLAGKFNTKSSKDLEDGPKEAAGVASMDKPAALAMNPEAQGFGGNTGA